MVSNIVCFSEDIFPNAVDYFQGPEEDDLDEEDIELGSEDDSGKLLKIHFINAFI